MSQRYGSKHSNRRPSQTRKVKYQDEKEKEQGIIKRMTDCWQDNHNQCGPREYLEELMKKHKIHYEKDHKWAKYKILGASIIIEPRVFVTKQDFKPNQKISESATRLEQNSKQQLFLNLTNILQCKLIIHLSTSFPSATPQIINQNSNPDSNYYHLLIDSNNILHHIELSKTHNYLLDTFYSDPNPSISLVKSNWETYINNVKGQIAQEVTINDELTQSDQEVMIIEPPSQSISNSQPKNQPLSSSLLIDQLSEQEILQIVNDESLSSYQENMEQSILGNWDDFHNFWNQIVNKNNYNRNIDNLDNCRDYFNSFNNIYLSKILEPQNNCIRPTQNQILTIFLNYQREVLIRNEIGMTRQEYLTRRQTFMDKQFQDWLKYDAQINSPRLWSIYDVENFDEMKKSSDNNALLHQTDNIFVAGSGFTGYSEQQQKGQLCFSLVVRELGEYQWVCPLNNQNFKHFIYQFSRFFYNPSLDIGFLAPNYTRNIALCMFCVKLMKWQEALGHYCPFNMSGDLTKSILQSSVNRK